MGIMWGCPDGLKPDMWHQQVSECSMQHAALVGQSSWRMRLLCTQDDHSGPLVIRHLYQNRLRCSKHQMCAMHPAQLGVQGAA